MQIQMLNLYTLFMSGLAGVILLLVAFIHSSNPVPELLIVIITLLFAIFIQIVKIGLLIQNREKTVEKQLIANQE